MKPQEEMARKTLEEFTDEMLGVHITLDDLVVFLFLVFFAVWSKR